jgi:hypothetical protein
MADWSNQARDLTGIHRDTFKAAVALHYAYYNSVKSNIAIRCTPAMAAGVANSLWTVRDLVEMVEA